MFPINRFIRSFFKFLAVIVSVFLPVSAFTAPPAGVLDDAHAAVRAVMAVQGEVTPAFMQQPGREEEWPNNWSIAQRGLGLECDDQRYLR